MCLERTAGFNVSRRRMATPVPFAGLCRILWEADTVKVTGCQLNQPQPMNKPDSGLDDKKSRIKQQKKENNYRQEIGIRSTSDAERYAAEMALRCDCGRNAPKGTFILTWFTVTRFRTKYLRDIWLLIRFAKITKLTTFVCVCMCLLRRIYSGLSGRNWIIETVL